MEITRCTSRHAHSCYPRPSILRVTPKQQRNSCRSALYNRELELQKLDRLLSKEPSSINVILGPRSCGKTAILRSHLKDKRKSMYLDCRETKVNTPAAFVAAVLELLLRKSPEGMQGDVRAILKNMLQAMVVIASGVKMNWKDLPVPALLGKEDVSLSITDIANSLLSSNQRPPPNMKEVYMAISNILDVWNEPLASWDGYEWPVLVIDEANQLQEWKDEYNSELAELLSFLVQISKQSKRCHVLLATSEYGFQAWLNNAIGRGFWQPKVIGDFTEDHARKFLESELQRRQKQAGSNATWAKLDDAAWMKVYKVCGGNAGDLVRLSAEIDHEDWDTALERLWRVERQGVRNLAVGVRGAWTPVQYAEVALQLLDSRYHAIPKEDVEILLGRHVVAAASALQQQEAGVPVLQRLVQDNALSLRPFSDWAQDIPREAFGNADSVVTAPSTMNLYCMSELRQVLQTNLQTATGHYP